MLVQTRSWNIHGIIIIKKEKGSISLCQRNLLSWALNVTRKVRFCWKI